MSSRTRFIPVAGEECPDPALDVKVDARAAAGGSNLPSGWVMVNIGGAVEATIVTTNINPSVVNTTVVVFGGVEVLADTGASGIVRLYFNGVLKDFEAVAALVYETVSLVGGTEGMGTDPYAVELKIYNNTGSAYDFWYAGAAIAAYSVK